MSQVMLQLRGAALLTCMVVPTRRSIYDPILHYIVLGGHDPGAWADSAPRLRNLQGKGVFSSGWYLEKLLSHHNVLLGVASQPILIEDPGPRPAPIRSKCKLAPLIAVAFCYTRVTK